MSSWSKNGSNLCFQIWNLCKLLLDRKSTRFCPLNLAGRSPCQCNRYAASAILQLMGARINNTSSMGLTSAKLGGPSQRYFCSLETYSMGTSRGALLGCSHTLRLSNSEETAGKRSLRLARTWHTWAPTARQWLAGAWILCRIWTCVLGKTHQGTYLRILARKSAGTCNTTQMSRFWVKELVLSQKGTFV